jgi:hypothetical protein
LGDTKWMLHGLQASQGKFTSPKSLKVEKILLHSPQGACT